MNGFLEGERIAIWKISHQSMDAKNQLFLWIEFLMFVSYNYVFPMKIITIMYFDLVPLYLYHFLLCLWVSWWWRLGMGDVD